MGVFYKQSTKNEIRKVCLLGQDSCTEEMQNDVTWTQAGQWTNCLLRSKTFGDSKQWQNGTELHEKIHNSRLKSDKSFTKLENLTFPCGQSLGDWFQKALEQTTESSHIAVWWFSVMLHMNTCLLITLEDTFLFSTTSLPICTHGLGQLMSKQRWKMWMMDCVDALWNCCSPSVLPTGAKETFSLVGSFKLRMVGQPKDNQSNLIEHMRCWCGREMMWTLKRGNKPTMFMCSWLTMKSSLLISQS